METCGGTISGYCASGIVYSAKTPAIGVTIEMTMASGGRSTKIDESIESALPKHLGEGACPPRCPRTYPLQPFDDEGLAPGQAGFDHHVAPALTAGLDAFGN